MMGIMLSGPAAAKIYRYVDDKGQVNFTNDLSIIPEKKRDKVTEQEEIQGTYHPPATRSVRRVPVTPSSQNNEKFQKKQQLEAEYQELLKEKEVLDNNKSFQKRRKRKEVQAPAPHQGTCRKRTAGYSASDKSWAGVEGIWIDGTTVNGQVNINKDPSYDRLSDLVGNKQEDFLVL